MPLHAGIFCFVDFAARGCYDAAMKTIIAVRCLLSQLRPNARRSDTPRRAQRWRAKPSCEFYALTKPKDASRMAQFYNADATFVDPTFELNLKGPDQIHDLLSKALAKYESLDWEIAHTTTAGDDLIVEGKMIGKLGTKTMAAFRLCQCSISQMGRSRRNAICVQCTTLQRLKRSCPTALRTKDVYKIPPSPAPPGSARRLAESFVAWHKVSGK